MSESKINKKFYPKIGFCVLQNPMEAGTERSPQILIEAKKEFNNYSVNFIPFNEIVDNVEKAETAGEFFYENKIDVLLLVEATYSYDFLILDILEYVDVPVICWAIPGMDNGSLCGFQLLGVTLYEIGRNYKIFYGEINDKKIHNKILSYSRAASIKKFLRKQKIGLIGYRMSGMTEVTFDEWELKRTFGPRVVHFGINHIQEMSGKIGDDEAMKVWDSVKSSVAEITVSDKDGIISCKNYLALSKIAKKTKISGFTVDCYPDFLGQFCLAASLLAKEDIILACEGDVNSVVSMIILNYFTEKPVINTDLLNPDSENSVIFSHCGSGDFSLSKDSDSINLCPVRVVDYGLCVLFLPKLGDITLMNIVGRKDSYRISVIEAYSQETEMVFAGNPVSARFNISAEKFLDIVAENAIGHHWMIGYGKVLEEIKYLSGLLGVKFIDFALENNSIS